MLQVVQLTFPILYKDLWLACFCGTFEKCFLWLTLLSKGTVIFESSFLVQGKPGLKGCMEKRPKWLIISYHCLISNWLFFPYETEGELSVASVVTQVCIPCFPYFDTYQSLLFVGHQKNNGSLLVIQQLFFFLVGIMLTICNMYLFLS